MILASRRWILQLRLSNILSGSLSSQPCIESSVHKSLSGSTRLSSSLPQSFVPLLASLIISSEISFFASLWAVSMSEASTIMASTSESIYSVVSRYRVGIYSFCVGCAGSAGLPAGWFTMLSLVDGHTDYVVTNDFAQNNTSVVQQACNRRWKIEQFHREIKQLTDIEGGQCRLARIVRNHIGCAMLVWVRLKTAAYQTGQTMYQLKHSLFAQCLRQQLKKPNIQMKFS